jgi:hypothetical protein
MGEIVRFLITCELDPEMGYTTAESYEDAIHECLRDGCLEFVKFERYYGESGSSGSQHGQDAGRPALHWP